jgi:Peptidase family M1 domain
MPSFARYSPLVVLLVLGASARASGHGLAVPDSRGVQTASLPTPGHPRALYQALNALRPDPSRVYAIRSLSLRRDVIDLTFDEGKLAFVEPLGGRITGIVFAGRGHVIAMPHDAGERRSLAQFVGLPILDQTFYRAYLRFDDRTAGEMTSNLEKAGDKPTTDAEFAASWEPVFANGNSWQSLRIMEDWLSTAPIPYFYAGILSDTNGPIDLLVDGRRSEQVLFGQPKISAGGRAYDTWCSFPAQDAGPASSDTFVPLDYRIATQIADDLSLSGTTTMHLKAMRGGQQVLPLEISRRLVVDSVADADGAPLTYFQNEDLTKRQILSRGNDTALVILPAPIREGQEIHLQVAYHGRVISDAGNGVDYVGEHETWYAHPAGTHYFASFNLSFRWPKRLTLVATGRNVDRHADGDFETGTWVSDVPFAQAGFNLGQYQAETANDTRPRIELYANQQLESAILARLPQMTLPPPLPSGPAPFRPNGLGTDAPPTPRPASVLRSLGAQILDSIRFYENLDGPFPFADLAVSQIPGLVGQGWPGLLYLSTLAYLPPAAEDRAGIAQLTQQMAREVMPFHEVAHQWWGNIAVAATYRDVWVDEGMANYLALMYADSRKPNAHGMKMWLERYRSDLLAKAPDSEESVEQVGPLIMGYRLESSKDPRAYNVVIYDKGTWVMHMIREMLRDPSSADPDARFRGFLHDFLAQYRFRPFTTADFERALEQHMTSAMDLEGGHSLSWFFDEWVKNTGVPRYAIQFETRVQKRGYLVTGRIQQTEVDDLFTAAVPIYASRQGQKPERLGTVVTTGPDTSFRFLSRIRPTRLVIDPDLTLLCRTD